MKISIFGRIFPILLAISSVFTSCEKTNSDDQPGDPVNITTEIYQKEVIDSANKFALDLFKPAINADKGSENIMISPFSITSALSMTLNGASGETFEAIRKTLGFKEKTLEQINSTYLKLMTEMVPVDKRVLVEIANSVWIEKRLTVKQKFISDVQTWYKAEARNIDVNDAGAVDIVNGWIEEKTHNKINDMLDYLDPDLAMLLINAVYFNGIWRYQFDKADTKQEPFYITPSVSKDVPMMHLTENLKAASLSNITLVEIPYGQGNYTMVVAMPEETLTTKDIANLLTPELWKQWTDLLSENTGKVALSMPRFKYEYKRLLNEDLIGMGMGIAFTPDADFSNISDQGLMISRVLHQTFIDTNEEGTEAAAATVVEVVLTSAGPGLPITIRIDKPFLYFIREASTGTILFIGRVDDPVL
jgi:serine protease inhibitor